ARVRRSGRPTRRRGDPRGLARACARGGRLLRAGVRSRACRARIGGPRAGVASRLRDHRSRVEGSRVSRTTQPRAGRGRRRSGRDRGGVAMTVRVLAPATTANLGPGYDCAAVALDLWNELEVSEGDGEVDLDHLGVQAFAWLAPVDGLRFAFVDR